MTGVGFVVLGLISAIIQGEPKQASDPVNEIVDFYVDNKDSIMAAQVIGAISGLLLLAFDAYLASALRRADDGAWALPLLPLLGLVIMDVGFAIDGTILIALAEAADDIEPTSVQTLQALWDNDFLPIALGAMVFLFSFGIAVVRSGALPKWLGWVVIALGVIALIPPIGFASFVGMAILIWSSASCSRCGSVRRRRPSLPERRCRSVARGAPPSRQEGGGRLRTGTTDPVGVDDNPRLDMHAVPARRRDVPASVETGSKVPLTTRRTSHSA